jgi:hypothetical protein
MTGGHRERKALAVHPREFGITAQDPASWRAGRDARLLVQLRVAAARMKQQAMVLTG